MTFDEWMLTKDNSYVPTDDSMQLRLLRECWFSRDADVAELVEALEHSVLYVPDLATVPGIAAALAKVSKP